MTRGERRARTERVVEHRRRDWMLSAVGSGQPEWWTPNHAGRARKMHPFDCGRPRCSCKLPVNDTYRRDERQMAEARDEAELPECWPSAIDAEIEELYWAGWMEPEGHKDAHRSIDQRFRETFPI